MAVTIRPGAELYVPAGADFTRTQSYYIRVISVEIEAAGAEGLTHVWAAPIRQDGSPTRRRARREGLPPRVWCILRPAKVLSRDGITAEREPLMSNPDQTPRIRYATRKDAIEQAIAPALQPGHYDLEAICTLTFDWRIDTDGQGNELLNTGGFEQVITEAEFWAAIADHQLPPAAPVEPVTPEQLADVPVEHRRLIARWLAERAAHMEGSLIFPRHITAQAQNALAGAAVDLCNPFDEDTTIGHGAELLAGITMGEAQ